MSLTDTLTARSSTCELCAATDSLAPYTVPPRTSTSADDHALLCPTCLAGQDAAAELDVHHWRCLTTSMWSEVPAVQVLAWRLLSRLAATESWARENLDMLYLEDDVRTWAEDGFEAPDDSPAVVHKDANGAVLESGDTVTLIKDLKRQGRRLHRQARHRRPRHSPRPGQPGPHRGPGRRSRDRDPDRVRQEGEVATRP